MINFEKYTSIEYNQLKILGLKKITIIIIIGISTMNGTYFK